ncbi:MAG: hypothetical protein Q7O66_13675 [Dehalococcoidia bacterium]|nr:hypothetical protein [Dehalococcoidia bacterium]
MGGTFCNSCFYEYTTHHIAASFADIPDGRVFLRGNLYSIMISFPSGNRRIVRIIRAIFDRWKYGLKILDFVCTFAYNAPAVDSKVEWGGSHGVTSSIFLPVCVLFYVAKRGTARQLTG